MTTKVKTPEVGEVIEVEKLEATPPEPKYMENFSVTQRRLIDKNLRDSLINSEGSYFKKQGAYLQSMMREAISFTCLHKPLKGLITDEKYIDGDGNEQVRLFVTFKIDLFQPGTNDKWTVERKFTKISIDAE